MNMRLSVLFIISMMMAIAAAFPSDSELRDKRDVSETLKDAWGGVVKTITEASDAVVHVFKPTEKSTVDKVADSIKGLAE